MRKEAHMNLFDDVKHNVLQNHLYVPPILSKEDTRGVSLRLLWLLELSFLKSAAATRLNMDVSLAARRCAIAEGKILHTHTHTPL